MSDMNYKQKWIALNALASASIKTNVNDDWYVDQPIEVGGDGMLTSVYGIGATPEQAIENHWLKLADNLPEGKYLVINNKKGRKHYRWKEFMWAEQLKGSE